VTIIGLELVPTSLRGGPEGAREEAEKVRELLKSTDLGARLTTLVVPQIIPEDGGRPVSLDDKMDPADFRAAVSPVLPGLSFVLTQVTILSTVAVLDARIRSLTQSGVDRLVFIGAPRDGGQMPLPGLRPEEALARYATALRHRGVILIPTRDGEVERLQTKVEAGATFALTQMLFNDFTTGFMRRMARFPQRPEVLLSFAYVPKKERERGLLKWLIQHRGPDNVAELAALDSLIDLSYAHKKTRLVELYRRVAEGVAELGFPVGVHFESPYGVSEPAFETFNEMLNAFSPQGVAGRA